MSPAWQWIAAIGLPVVLGLLGFWWRVEARQDKSIKEMADANHKAHSDLHDKIDRNHNALRDKVQEIWEHLVHRHDK